MVINYTSLAKGSSQRQKLLLWFFVLGSFCFSITIARAFATETLTYVFLIRNLVLAGIPLLISSWLVALNRNTKKVWYFFPLLFVWLLFIPNAPYILTDFFHFRYREVAPLWYDLGIIIAFAWTGFLMGMASIGDIETMIEERFGRKWAFSTIVLLWFMCSYGVYLGRFLRYNSWDFIHSPLALIQDVLQPIITPGHHWAAWGMTLLYGLLFNLIYWTPRLLTNRDLD